LEAIAAYIVVVLGDSVMTTTNGVLLRCEYFEFRLRVF